MQAATLVWRQQLMHRNSECMGQLLDIVDRDIPDPALDVRHKSSVQVGFQSQVFLRHRSFRSQPAKIAREQFARSASPGNSGR